MADLNINEIQKDLDKKKDDYIDLTHQLNNYNEIYNLNVYLQKLHSVEMGQISHNDQKMKTVSLKSKQQYLLTEFAIKEYNIRINLMYFTMIMMCIILILCGLYVMEKVGQKLVVTIIVTMCLFWAAIVFIIGKLHSNRRKYAYDQYYWKDIKKVNA